MYYTVNDSYFAPRRGVKYRDKYVCLSVRLHNSKMIRPIFTKFFVIVACGHGSVLF